MKKRAKCKKCGRKMPTVPEGMADLCYDCASKQERKK